MSRTSIIALLIFGAILGYFLSFGADTTRKFQASVYQLLAPFFTTGSGLQKQITSVRTGLKSLDELEKENASLRVDNRQLRATNSALRDVEHEVNRLRHALNYRERSVFKLIPAEIVTRDASTWWHTVTINRGKEDHIETDMPVVTDEGLVGKTTTVSNTRKSANKLKPATKEIAPNRCVDFSSHHSQIPERLQKAIVITARSTLKPQTPSET